MSYQVKCINHADTEAEASCFECLQPICGTCARTRDDGAIVCAACFNQVPLARAGHSSAMPPVPPPPPSSPYGSAPPPPPPPPPGVADELAPVEESMDLAPAAEAPRNDAWGFATPMLGPCVQHPEVAAVSKCRSCGAAVCATCQFSFPMAVNLCPTCATGSAKSMTPRQLKFFIISIVLGIVSPGIFVMLVIALATGSIRGNEAQAADLIGTTASRLASIAGLITGIMAFGKGLKNPAYLWTGPILNGIVLAGLTILIIISAVGGAR